jgi:predicted TIM-barrel fold metal-dependent hydrolase
MTYAENRTILDADSHIMEIEGFLDGYIDPEVRLRTYFFDFMKEFYKDAVDKLEARKADPTLIDEAAPRLMTEKAWWALGAFDSEERSKALDLLGFDGQLVFATFTWGTFAGKDTERMHLGASAHNRAMAAFCGNDPRMLAVAFVPLVDPEAARSLAEEAIDAGCKAIMIPHLPAGDQDRSPAHPDFDVFWEVLDRRNIPFVLHVGGGGRPDQLIEKGYHNNGKKPSTVFGGGGEAITAKDVLAVDHGPQVFLGTMIFDGLFDRFPNVRGGVIEQGAVWVVSWLRHLDHTATALSKMEPQLKELTMLPSEYVRKHLKFTPYPGEPVGWMIQEAGPELFMFSTDYPHPEGGTKPIKNFEETLGGVDEEAVARFYAGNMRELLTGSAVPAGI